MSAVRWPIELEEGSNFSLQVAWEDDDCKLVNVAGYGARFQVRNLPGSTPLVTATTANGRIATAVYGGVTSQFNITIPAASISALTSLISDDAEYTFVVWPTAASPSADPVRLMDGPVTYSRSFAD